MRCHFKFIRLAKMGETYVMSTIIFVFLLVFFFCLLLLLRCALNKRYLWSDLALPVIPLPPCCQWPALTRAVERPFPRGDLCILPLRLPDLLSLCSPVNSSVLGICWVTLLVFFFPSFSIGQRSPGTRDQGDPFAWEFQKISVYPRYLSKRRTHRGRFSQTVTQA